LELPACKGWGGARPGAGRPRAPGSGPSHARRAAHVARWPLHVTLRTRTALPSLRNARIFASLSHAHARSTKAAFRVLHFSVQTDHVHLILEADSSRALQRGIQGLAIRSARAINRVTNHSGRVWGHRYHARHLKTPTEMRHALAYVLLNFRKHLGAAPGVDPRSSGPWFDGWTGEYRRADGLRPVARPRTWLGAGGWRRGGGAIDTREAPSRS
jgi:REP element-mobilizing transposase RayT